MSLGPLDKCDLVEARAAWERFVNREWGCPCALCWESALDWLIRDSFPQYAGCQEMTEAVESSRAERAALVLPFAPHD